MALHRITRRFFGSILVLALASFLAFAVLDVAPGDAATTMIGEGASAEELEALREKLGLNRSMPARYLDYLGGVFLRGDLGKSLISGRPVAFMIGERFRYTLSLALVSTLLAALLGVVIGLWTARRQGSLADLGMMSFMSLAIAVPGFGVAMLLTLIFSLKLRLLPVIGSGTAVDMILPAITLALPMMAVIARLTRSSVLDAARADYVMTAHGKGVPDRKVWRRHILKNALVPVVTMIGLNCGHLLGGTFVVETIFSWPGLGRMIVQAVFEKDYPVILGSIVLLALIFQLCNLIIDVTHGVLDPRVGSEAV